MRKRNPDRTADRPVSRYQMRRRRHWVDDDAIRPAMSLDLSKLQVIFPFNPQSGGCCGLRFFQRRSLVFTANSKSDM